ncbi:nucleotidyltransferase domain-containing protein [Candidatus Woesearchaeota archaeon]|nr:nucleotidyltransferase domain-containing protein [Candidatus Woesearchaeota archaeon]
MALKNLKWDKILWLLFEHPEQKFTIRQISGKTRIPASSVQRYVKEIRKEGLIREGNRSANSNYAKFTKAVFMIDLLFQSGLIDYLDKKLMASAIIIFGSARKGEYDHESDIDLFVETTKEAKIELQEFEKRIGHAVQLFMEKDINDLPPHLFNNVANGIKLTGFFKVKK